MEKGKLKLGKKSIKQISTAHKDWKRIFDLAIRITTVDFGVSEGHRSVAKQLQLFNQKKSKVDGIVKLSKHNSKPSMAVDIFGYVKRKANYEIHNMCYLAGLIEACAAFLYNTEIITHKVRWGGNWDLDGEILTDQDFDDLCHFELYK